MLGHFSWRPNVMFVGRAKTGLDAGVLRSALNKRLSLSKAFECSYMPDLIVAVTILSSSETLQAYLARINYFPLHGESLSSTAITFQGLKLSSQLNSRFTVFPMTEVLEFKLLVA